MKATGTYNQVKDVDPLVALTEKTRHHIDHWVSKFPPDRKRSALIQGLMAAQEQQGGYLTDELTTAVAKYLDLPTVWAYEVATFYFTRLPDSYAARTGRPDNVGVIGIALFREKPRRVPCCAPMIEQRAAAEAAPPVLQDRGQQDRKPHSSEDALGTGHGHRESSPAQYVDFRRASSSPDETITLYYDSHRNLIAQGVLPARSRFAQEQPDPFPSRFVPDPPDP